MAFTPIEQAPARLNRSELAVPASNTRFLEKAAQSAADVVFLDLEDAVAPSDKDMARKNAIEAINDLDWGEKTVSVRINAADTQYMYRDVVDLMEQAGERLDLLMMPKVDNAKDVYALDMLCTQIEWAKGREKRVGFEHIMETAQGLRNIYEIAAASPRNESLHFGVADFAASMGMKTTQIGGPNPDYVVLSNPDENGERNTYWGDMWHQAIVTMVVAARSHGLRPIDGPFGDFSDPDGYRAQALRAKVLGCEGKWSIHPSQVDLGNELFSPSPDEIEKAKKVLDAMEQALAEGRGAVALDGKLIDIASVRQAEVLMETVKRLEG